MPGLSPHQMLQKQAKQEKSNDSHTFCRSRYFFLPNTSQIFLASLNTYYYTYYKLLISINSNSNHNSKSIQQCFMLCKVLPDKINTDLILQSIKRMNPDKNSEEMSVKENEEKQYHLTTKKKAVFWIYLLSLVVFVVSVSVLLSFGWMPIQQFKLSDSYFYANQVTYAWKQGFINDLVVTADKECPSGYEYAFKFQWPGTNYGCRCTPSDNLDFAINGICTPSLIQRNCRNMNQVEAFETYYWQNNSTLCMKRSSTSFLNEEKYNQKNKICGSSSSLVVVPLNEPCPLVNISFNLMTLQQNYKVVQDSASLLNPLYAAYNATSPYSFYTYPISGFAVSEQQFCLIDQDTGLNQEHSDFVLLLKQRGCSQTGNYSTLSTMTQKQFYANNPALSQITLIQGFPEPQSWNYHLGFKSLPSWKYQCRHNMDQKFHMSNTIPQFNFQFSNSYEPAAISLVVIICIVSAQLLIIFLKRVFDSRVYPIGFKQVYMPSEFVKGLIRFIIDAICKVGVLVITIYISYVSIYNWNWFKSAINENCFDGNPQLAVNVMSSYSKMYYGLIQVSVAKAAITFFIIIVDIVHFHYVYKTELRYYLVNPDGKMIMTTEERPFGLFEDIEKDRDQKMDNKEVENDNFRITMAMKINQDDDMIKKPRLKKKAKKLRNLIKEENRAQESKEQINIHQSQNPFMLYDNSISNQNIINRAEFQSKKPRRKRQ